jgi:dTDP-4-dehydrorhamnose reductase
MNILLVGRNGQLGWELTRTLAPLGDLQALDYPQIDLADLDATRRIIHQIKPNILVNAAAYTAVDQAEDHPETTAAINTIAPGVLADEAYHLGCSFIHFSTDYVFDGMKDTPYLESDTPNPINMYGRSKLDGEVAIQKAGGSYLILRTSWLYSLRPQSFVSRVLDWLHTRHLVKLVTDQVGSPTWARMLAEVTSQLISGGGEKPFEYFSAHSGVYHLGGSGYCSRYEWGQEIMRLDPRKDSQMAGEFIPALSADFPTPARRPVFSALNCELFTKTFHLHLPDWKTSLKLALEVQ